jgi:hypothetical protein
VPSDGVQPLIPTTSSVDRVATRNLVIDVWGLEIGIPLQPTRYRLSADTTHIE